MKYDTKNEFNQILKLLQKYNKEYKFMRIYMKEVRRHTEDEINLLTIIVDQLNQTVGVNIFDRDWDKEIVNVIYRFKKPLFKKLTDKLFKC